MTGFLGRMGKEERGESLRCPVCGYDQSGLVGSWYEACPLRGSCSECGASLDWAEVHRPGLFEEHHFFEHPAASFPEDLLRTCRRACLPGRFWAWAPRSQPLRVGRILKTVAASVVLGAVLPALAVLAVAFVLMYVEQARIRTASVPPHWAAFFQNNGPIRFLTRYYLPSVDVRAGLLAGVLWLHATTVIVAVVWALLARNRGVRLMHIVRCGCYLLGPLCAALVVDAGFHASRALYSYSFMGVIHRWSGAVVAAYPIVYLAATGVVAVWLWHGWVMFMTVYLRTPRPRLTVAAYGAISLLTLALSMLVASGLLS